MIPPSAPRIKSDFLHGFALGSRGGYTLPPMQKILSRSKFAGEAGVNPSTVTRLCETLLKAAVVGKGIDAAHPAAVEYLARKDRDQTAPAATGLDPLYEEAVEFCQTNSRYSITGLQRGLRIGYNRAARIVEMMKAAGLIPDPTTTVTTIEAVVKAAQALVPPKPRGQSVVKERKKQNYDPNGPIEVPEDIQAFADFTLRELIEKFGTDVRFVDWLAATQKIEAINEKRLKNATTKGELISRNLVKVGVIDVFNSAHLRLLKDGAKTIAAGVVSKQASGAELSEIEAFVSDILGSFIKPIKNKVNRALKNGN